ncbi:MAG: rhodanese-like domain-containing protein [Chitinispirillaceae bacterium]|nr:rhodanese-like domain-containing protein [Chitinispirillaceae bacterium]
MKNQKTLPLLAFLVVSTISASDGALVNVRADTLEQWITFGTAFDFIFIDIRDTAELTSIIATSACRPYHLSWNQGVFRARMNSLPKNAHLVMYCRTGNRSGQAGQLLVDSGYASVYHLAGGISGWTGSTMTSASIKPIAELPAPSMRAVSTATRQPPSAQGATLSLRQRAGTFIMPAAVETDHHIVLFDMEGRLLFEKKKPFYRTTTLRVPPDLAALIHVSVLFINNRPGAAILVNPLTR